MSFPWRSPYSFVFSTAEAAEDYALALVEDHCEEGKALLLEQFKKSPRLQALLCTYLDQVTLLEAALFELLRMRSLDTATGDQLDVLGRIVGQSREGLIDEVYRVFLRARVLVNNSSGTPEELIAIMRRVLEDTTDIQLQEQFPAAVVLITGYPLVTPRTPAIVFRLLNEARSAAVRLFLEYITVSASLAFTFSTSSSVEVSASLGFGDDTDPATGGQFAGVIAG